MNAATFELYRLLVEEAREARRARREMSNMFLTLNLAGVGALGIIARQLFGDRAAELTMVVLAIFPGSFVLSFAYTEALLMVLAGACLWFLLQRQWWLAGLFAALGTATTEARSSHAFTCGSGRKPANSAPAPTSAASHSSAGRRIPSPMRTALTRRRSDTGTRTPSASRTPFASPAPQESTASSPASSHSSHSPAPTEARHHGF